MARRCSWILPAMLVVCIGGAGCGPVPEEDPLTPADKARILEEMEASAGLREAAGMGDGPSAWCMDQSKLAQLAARQQRYRGADGFNRRGCGTGE